MTQERILNVSTMLFLQFGIKSVSMDDICRELGVSKKTIYTYVSNKKELVHLSFLSFMQMEEEVISEIHKSADNALDEMIKITDYTMKFLHMMKPTLTYDLQKYHKETWHYFENTHFKFIATIIFENLERGVKEGIYRSNIEPDILTKLFLGNIMVIIDEKIFPSRDYLKSNIYHESMSHHLYGIVNKKSIKNLEKYLKKLAR